MVTGATAVPMHLINGTPADQISVMDRGLLYGQTVFETIAIEYQQPLLLDQHLRRLVRGCATLAIELDNSLIKAEVMALCKAQQTDRSVLRITLSMGQGGRGYLNPKETSSKRILSLHEYPEIPDANWSTGIMLGVASIQLSQQPALAGIKHGNRLEQVIARSQWRADWQEALLLDQHENVIEGTQSNLFIRAGDIISTPDLYLCGVAGIMRDQVLGLADKVGATPQIMSLSLDDVARADEVFVCNSLIGLWPVREFQGHHYTDFSISHKLLKLLKENGSIPTF